MLGIGGSCADVPRCSRLYTQLRMLSSAFLEHHGTSVVAYPHLLCRGHEEKYSAETLRRRGNTGKRKSRDSASLTTGFLRNPQGSGTRTRTARNGCPTKKEGGVRLVRSHLGLATRFGSRGLAFPRDRRHNGSREHELPTRRDEWGLAQRNRLQRSSRNFPEEHAQYPTR